MQRHAGAAGQLIRSSHPAQPAAKDFPGIELRDVAPCRSEAVFPNMSQSAG
jgi:hypothetical protein